MLSMNKQNYITSQIQGYVMSTLYKATDNHKMCETWLDDSWSFVESIVLGFFVSDNKRKNYFWKQVINFVQSPLDFWKLKTCKSVRVRQNNNL